MIAEIGLALLWFAAAMALLQVFAGLAVLISGKTELALLVKPAAVAQAALCGLAFLALIWLFYTTDLSVLLVASNSHVDKPMIYKLAATWGNHEGSMLLWVTILSCSSGAIALFARRLDNETLIASLMAQAMLGLGFFAFLFFASNPFARLFPAATEGQGLNPLLQDLGLAFHPPTLYLGYVGLSVAFSFAVGAMLTGKVTPQFARAMRPWVLGAWIFLTLGITAGSYWAYYELGWGGWWFWDPVENASLMPWLAATALLHSVSVMATRDALRAWTIMLALLAFAMSMAGTFLVRSGILTSVHAFAVDPRRGAFILGLLFLYVGAAFILFALRIGSVRQGKTFILSSREGAIVANNILLSTILGVILIGTLYPILAEAMGTQISVGAPYFNKATMPIALLLMLLLAFGPMLRWRQDSMARLLPKLVLPALILLGVFGSISWLFPHVKIMPVIVLALAIALLVTSLLPLWGRSLLRTPLPIWGMVIAHMGFAVSLAGMALETGFSSEKLAAVAVGDHIKIADWDVQLTSIAPAYVDNTVAIEGTLLARKNGKTFHLNPQIRYFTHPEQETNETAILTRWNGQLYTVIAPIKGAELDGKCQIRLWWKPFVTLIWAGGFLIAMGGLVTLLGRIFRRRKKRSHEDDY